MVDEELDAEGKISFDFKDELVKMASNPEKTNDLASLLLENGNEKVLDAVYIEDIPLSDFVNDQELAEFLLDRNLTNMSFKVVNIIETALLRYSEGKEEYDERLSSAVSFDYKVINEFETSGNKMPEILSHTAIFIDCRYLHFDLSEMINDLSQLLKEANKVMYLLIEKRKDAFLQTLSTDNFACCHVPEVDVVLKDQMDLYMLTSEEILMKTDKIKSDLAHTLKSNLDGSPNKNGYKMLMPTAAYMETNSMFKAMISSVNVVQILVMFLLSIIVVYSLMISDVNEQTYQFAMMRALGFSKDHVLVFIILQAFSFAVPGLLIGLLLALLLNDAFREVVYYDTHYAGEYGLSGSSMLVSAILMGFAVPLISNIGPTREALKKNLRTSLDASRHDGGDEAVSAVV